jgi:hypothetical protein
MSNVTPLFPAKNKGDTLREVTTYADGAARYQVVLVTEVDPTYPMTGGIPAYHVVLTGIDGDQPGQGYGLEFLASFTLDEAGRRQADMVGKAVAKAVIEIECDLDPTPDLSAQQ